jgi:4-amino-4-deoxy-L-arabinose transferase-like glycosyltransferase
MALILPALTAVAYVAVSGCWKKAAALRPFSGALLLLAMTAPWFVLAGRQTSADGSGGFVGGHAHLVAGHTGFYDYVAHLPGSALYSIANFPLDFMPWTFLFVPAAISLWPEKDSARRGAPLFLLLWFVAVFLFPHLSVVEHSHYLFFILVPTALVVGIHLDRMLAAAVDEKAQRRTDRFMSVFCYFIIVMGIALPIVAALQGPDLIFQNLAVGLAGVLGAMGLLYELKRRNYPALAFGLASLMTVINLLVQGLVLPPVNAREVRPFAENMRSFLKPDSVIGVYLYHQPPFREFNFYSQMERFQILQSPDAAENFLRQPGPRFILITRRRVNEIRKMSATELKPLLTQGGGGLEWWFPPSGRWVLLYSCSASCESATPAGETTIIRAHQH